MNVAVLVKKEVRESGLLFLYLHGTAGVTLSVVLQPIISQILIKWPLMLVFALSQLFCFVKLSCMPFWMSVRLFYRSYIREDFYQFPLKNDFSRILNPVLSIQDAYDQDQGIFSVLEKRRAVSSDPAEAGELSQGTFCEIRDFGIGLPKGQQHSEAVWRERSERCRFSKKRSSRKRASFFISARDSWRNLECSLTA